MHKLCPQCGKRFGPEDLNNAYNFKRQKTCSRACHHAGKKFTPERAVKEFWAKIHKGERCWIWMGAKHFRGYGACGLHLGDTRTHRVSWILTNGPIPKGQGVLHKCDTPLCVNPSHLYLGDQKQNAEDRKARGRRGHRYMPVEQLLHPQLSQRGKLTKQRSVQP
jgi:hypothetical protein